MVSATTYCIFEPPSMFNSKFDAHDVNATPKSVRGVILHHMLPSEPPSYQEVNVVKPVKRSEYEEDPRWMGGHNPP